MKEYNSHKEKFDEIERLRQKAKGCYAKAEVMEEEIVRQMIEERGLQQLVIHKESGKKGRFTVVRSESSLRITFHGLKKDGTPSKNRDSLLGEWLFYPSERRIAEYLSGFEHLDTDP